VKFPGPGTYQTQGKIDKITVGERAPIYSFKTSGQVKVSRKAVTKVHEHHKKNGIEDVGALSIKKKLK
jgi:hypothetical protein